MAFDATTLREAFGPDVVAVEEFRGNRRAIVGPDRIFAVLQKLKDSFGFDMLTDVAGFKSISFAGNASLTARSASDMTCF